MSYFLGKGQNLPVSSNPFAQQQAQQGIDQSADCRKQCYDRYNQMLSDANVSDTSAMAFLNKCLSECASQPQPAAGASAVDTVSPIDQPGGTTPVVTPYQPGGGSDETIGIPEPGPFEPTPVPGAVNFPGCVAILCTTRRRTPPTAATNTEAEATT